MLIYTILLETVRHLGNFRTVISVEMSHRETINSK